MVTPAIRRILLLGLALAATTVLADDLMLGPGRLMSDADRRDATAPAEPAVSSATTTRVIYHDGHNAPVSVPVNPRGIDAIPQGGDAASADTAPAGSTTAADTSDTTTPARLPSAEPSVPQKPRNGLRWQSVLPGSIK